MDLPPRCRNCIYHQINEEGRFACAKGLPLGAVKNGKPCPSFHYPWKSKWNFKYENYLFYCVEAEYWNVVFEEIDYAIFISLYELPFEWADTERKPDHAVRLQSRDYLNFFDVREEAINAFEKEIKPLEKLWIGKRA